MRILRVHNFYGSEAPSGENQVFVDEGALLAAHGHEVHTLSRHSDEIRRQGALGAIRGALATPWNPLMARAMRAVVRRLRPAVVHVHNTFPLISNAIFPAIGSRAARVLTLHNYRLFCPAAIPLRAGAVCTQCLDRGSVLPALRYGCYRGSRAATLPLAISVGLHRWLGTWRDQVDAFIALTAFQREVMVAAGLPAERVHVKPNFYPGNPAVIPWAARRPVVVFVGRLTAEKGVATLVQAWLDWGEAAPELRIIGEGGLRPALERLAAGAPRVPVRFVGQVAGEAAQAEIARARLLVLPSECFEGFPLVLREAFAFGTPAAVSALGPLPSLVKAGENGVLFAPGDPGALLAAVRGVWARPAALERLGQGARAAFAAHYTAEATLRALMNIYEAAIQVSQARRRGR